MSIGKNLAKYRKAKRLTQEELGEKLGVTNQAVSKWESEASMPDVMLLPEIATALNITLDDLYGIAKEPEKISCSADDFPAFCHQKLIELFYYNTKMRFTHIGSSDKEQLEFQIKKLMEGCRIGCLSNKEGAIVTTEDFSFIDNTFKAVNSENVIKSQADDYMYCVRHISIFPNSSSYTSYIIKFLDQAILLWIHPPKMVNAVEAYRYSLHLPLLELLPAAINSSGV